MKFSCHAIRFRFLPFVPPRFAHSRVDWNIENLHPYFLVLSYLWCHEQSICPQWGKVQYTQRHPNPTLTYCIHAHQTHEDQNFRYPLHSQKFRIPVHVLHFYSEVFFGMKRITLMLQFDDLWIFSAAVLVIQAIMPHWIMIKCTMVDWCWFPRGMLHFPRAIYHLFMCQTCCQQQVNHQQRTTMKKTLKF